MKEVNRMSKMKGMIKHREFRTVVFLILLFLLVGLVNSDYISAENIQNSLKNSLLYIVLAARDDLRFIDGRNRYFNRRSIRS